MLVYLEYQVDIKGYCASVWLYKGKIFPKTSLEVVIGIENFLNLMICCSETGSVNVMAMI